MANKKGNDILRELLARIQYYGNPASGHSETSEDPDGKVTIISPVDTSDEDDNENDENIEEYDNVIQSRLGSLCIKTIIYTNFALLQ